MEKYCVVFVTVDKKRAADKITSAVLKPRLAAGVNAIGGVSSFYRWKGKIEKAGEILLIMKTRASLVPAVMKAVRKAHTYEVPEIIAVDIKKGNADYLKWIGNETNLKFKIKNLKIRAKTQTKAKTKTKTRSKGKRK